MKRIMLFIIISCFVLQITGCTKSSQQSANSKNSTTASTQATEQNDNRFVDYEELKKNAQ